MNTLAQRPYAEIRGSRTKKKQKFVPFYHGGRQALGRTGRWLNSLQNDPFGEKRQEEEAKKEAEKKAKNALAVVPVQEEPVPSGAFAALTQQEDLLAKVFSMLDWKDLVLRVRRCCMDWNQMLQSRGDIFAHTTIDFNDLDVDRRYCKLDSFKKKGEERLNVMVELEKKHGISIDVQQNLLARVRNKSFQMGGTKLAMRRTADGSVVGSLVSGGSAAADDDSESQQADLEDIIKSALAQVKMQQDPITPASQRVNFRKILEQGWETFGIFDQQWIDERLAPLEQVEQQLHEAGKLPYNTNVRMFDALSSTFNEYEYFPGCKYDWTKEESSKGNEDGDDVEDEEDDEGKVEAQDYNSLDNYYLQYRRILYGDEFWQKGFNREVAMYYDLEVERRDKERLWLSMSLASNLANSAPHVDFGVMPALRERRLREVANPVLQWLADRRSKAIDANEARNILLMVLNFDQPTEEEEEQNDDDDDIDEGDEQAGAPGAGEDATDDIGEVSIDELVYGYRSKQDLAAYLQRQQRRRAQQQQAQQQNIMFGMPQIDLAIPRNDTLCSLEKLDQYLGSVSDFYPRTLSLIHSFQGNLKTLKLSGIECDPLLLKSVLLQLPFLENLSLLFTRVITRFAAISQYKKCKRITNNANADEIDENDPAQANWAIASKDELEKISKNLRNIEIDQLVAINSFSGDLIIYDQQYSDTTRVVSLFLEWLVLLTRKQLETIDITLNNAELAAGPFSGWIRRFGLEFDNSLVGCLFPKIKVFRLREFVPSIDNLKRVSATDLQLFFSEASAGTLQEIELLVSFNPTQLLCDIVKMPHLRDNLVRLEVGVKCETSRINDTERDENQRAIRLAVNSYGGVDSLRFQKLEKLNLTSTLMVAYNVPRPSAEYDNEVAFLSRFANGLSRLAAACLIGPVTRSVHLPGYDSALINAIWASGKTLKKLTINSQFEGELIDTLATVAPPNLAVLIAGDPHVLHNEETGEYDRRQQEFLAKANFVSFNSLKNLFKRCDKNLKKIQLNSTSVTRDEGDILAVNQQRNDPRAQVRGGKVRAFAEALAELVEERRAQGLSEEEATKGTALEELASVPGNDLDGCSDAEMRAWQPYFKQLKTIVLHRTITHNTLVKLAAGMPEGLEVIDSFDDLTGGHDLFSLVLLTQKFQNLKEISLPKTLSSYIYIDTTLKATLQKSEELEMKQWQAIMKNGSQQVTKPIFRWRPKLTILDVGQQYPFALQAMNRLAVCATKEELESINLEGVEPNAVKKQIRKEYDAKYKEKPFARLKRTDRKQLKMKYLRTIEHAVKIKLLQYFIQFEGPEEEKTRDEWIAALRAEQDPQLDADIIDKVSETILKLKTYVPPNSSVFDSDDEGQLFM